MDAQEFRNLQEAYMEVVENQQQLDEAPFQVYDMRDNVNVGKEMKNKKRARNKADRLDQEYGGYRYKVIPTGNDRPEVKYGDKKEQVDLYNIIFSHLLDEGYAETPEAAEAIMVNMSEEWWQSIVESDEKKSQELQRLQRLQDYENRYHRKRGGKPDPFTRELQNIRLRNLKRSSKPT